MYIEYPVDKLVYVWRKRCYINIFRNNFSLQQGPILEEISRIPLTNKEQGNLD